MNIYGKIVKLRAFEIDDMDEMRNIVNDPEVESLVGGWSFPVSKTQQMLWYDSIIKDKNNLRFAIDTKEDGFIGMADLRDIDWKNRCAFHGIKIGNKDYRGKGYGTDTVMAIMRYAFEELQLNRLDGSIISYNDGSKKLYCDKCGWKIEGIRRKYIFRNNSYFDQYIVGILRDEYYKLIEETHYWDD